MSVNPSSPSVRVFTSGSTTDWLPSTLDDRHPGLLVYESDFNPIQNTMRAAAALREALER